MAPNDGLFPVVDTSESVPGLHELRADHEGFTNYTGFDEDDRANNEPVVFAAKCMLKEFDTYEKCKYFLGGEPV